VQPHQIGEVNTVEVEVGDVVIPAETLEHWEKQFLQTLPVLVFQGIHHFLALHERATQGLEIFRLPFDGGVQTGPGGLGNVFAEIFQALLVFVAQGDGESRQQEQHQDGCRDEQVPQDRPGIGIKIMAHEVPSHFPSVGLQLLRVAQGQILMDTLLLSTKI